MKIVMDADCLIKLTKGEAKETVLKNMEVHIPPGVKTEVIDQGVKKNCPDAFMLRENLSRGLIKVKRPSGKAAILKGGEAEVLSLYREGGYDAVGSDDSKFLSKLETLNVKYVTPASCLVFCHLKGALPLPAALKFLENMKLYISTEEYTLAKFYLEGTS